MVAGSSYAIHKDSVIDKTSPKKNGVGVELMGTGAGVAVIYERIIYKSNSSCLYAHAGFGGSLLSITGFTAPLGMHISLGKKNLKAILGTGLICRIGKGQTYGYGSSVEFFNDNCGGVGCTKWYPKTIVHYYGMLGLKWDFHAGISVRAAYTPIFEYNYYRTSTDLNTKSLRQWGSLSIIKRF